MHKEVEVVLSAPLKYTKNGEKAEEQILILRSPSLAISQVTRKHARKLKALAGSAFIEAQGAVKKLSSGEQPKVVAESSDEGNIADLYSIAGIDLSDMCDVMRELAPSVVTIGEKESFKPSHWDALSMEDQEKVLGVFIQNFSMHSVSSSQAK